MDIFDLFDADINVWGYDPQYVANEPPPDPEDDDEEGRGVPHRGVPRGVSPRGIGDWGP